MNGPRIVLVVPCYREAARLSTAAFIGFLPARPWLALLFVDDGSDDGTGDVLASIESACPGQARVLRLPGHSGKSEAVRAGVLDAARSQPDYLGFWDADLATPLEALDDFVALARRRPDVDILIGSRVNVMGRDIRRGAARHYVSRVFATAASIALDLPVYDTQCGAKLFRASDDVLGVFAKPFDSRWIFDVEILERYVAVPVRDGGAPRCARIYEVVLPTWRDVPGSKLRVSDFLWSFVEVFRIWRRRRARGWGAGGLGSSGVRELGSSGGQELGRSGARARERDEKRASDSGDVLIRKEQYRD